MGDVAEQRPDERRPPGEHGTELERAQSAAPEQQPQQLDPEQLRQFQQFQQFQEFLRFTEAQKQGGELTPAQAQQPVPGADPGQQAWLPAQPPPPGGPPQARPDTLPAPLPRPKAPRWLKRLGGKLLSALLLLIVLAIGGKLAYDHFFPSADENLPADIAGKGTYSATELLQPNPYRAVQLVYQQIAQNRPDLACGNFSKPTQQKFAVDMGYADCKQAVEQLSKLVTNKSEYAQSIPFTSSSQPPGDVVPISSCDYDIKGGRPLGSFTVTRQHKDTSGGDVKGEQWLITGHEPGASPCATPVSPSTPPTR
ncbi:hypothetical protein [Amycolatopsis anabasis]|uniref:hypothetical protein n=1 Tax=Amycolatopsis anabasis TaxID=1840409 RepID=UPI00131B1853|nr:hypothetical protein [Amycolatopsis anabasis]